MATIINCENGHFYDADKYSTCPYCKRRQETAKEHIYVDVNGHRRGDRQEDEGKTVALTPLPRDSRILLGSEGEKKVPVRGIKANEEGVTIAMFSPAAGTGYVTGWLVGLSSSVKGKDFRIYAGRNHIGSGYGNDICIRDAAGIQEKNHCALVYDHRGNAFYMVPEEGAQTYLNEEPLCEPKRLFLGDRIRIGEAAFDFVPYCREGYQWEE